MPAVKERRFLTPASKWSLGRTHRMVWSYENKVWYVVCRGPWNNPHGTVSKDVSLPVTCQRCQGWGVARVT